jgi:hypothetical protein
VTNDIGDNGLTINQLYGAAWVLGLAALGSVIPVITYAGHPGPIQGRLIVWAFVGVIAAVFSACCAVLAGVKSAEQRVSRILAQTDA